MNMMNLQTYTLLLLFLTCYACSSEPNSITDGQESDNLSSKSILISVHDAPSPTRIPVIANSEAYAIIPYTLTYIDDNKIVREILPSDSVLHLNFNEERKVVELAIEYRPSALLKYYLSPGDKAIFSFVEGIPLLELMNQPTRPVMPNLDLQLIEEVQRGQPRSRDMARRPIDYMPYDFVTGNPVEHDRLLKDFTSNLKNNLVVETSTELERLRAILRSDSISIPEFELREAQLLNLLDSLPESTAHSTFSYTHAYHEEVKNTVAKMWYSSTKRAGADKAKNLIAVVNSDTSMTKEQKKQVKRAIVNIAVQNQTLEEYIDPIDLIMDDSDVAFLSFLREDRQSQDILSDPDLIVVNSQGDTSDFNEFLHKQEGKYVYVDLWASWCAPCREVMPESEKLRNTFKNQAVSFIYLAIHDNHTKWLDAARNEAIHMEEGNLFALNAKTATYLKDLGVREIPRYLLYGPDGVLIFRNALPPKSIGPLLNKLLNSSEKDSLGAESIR